MSKESFSKTMSDLMYQKIKALEYTNIENFFKKDEYFELALCLAYMTLSKEKIIYKEMGNKNRMDRLTNFVDMSNIDKVFKAGFCSSMPTIYKAEEENNLWRLDNIRDSIMHGVFDIDEDKKCFEIKNEQHDRNFVATVPFEWFIAYAKNDILSSKILDEYNVKGFFYNKYKKDKKYFNTKRETLNTILYNVHITGDKFNVKNIENRIFELFKEYSEKEIEESQIDSYREEINNEKRKYNEIYLATFYIARDKVIEIIEKEFPNTKVEIRIDDRKYKLINKISKRMQNYYRNYDLFFENINGVLRKKGMSLLKYITNIIENLDTVTEKQYNEYTTIEIMQLMNLLLDGDKEKYTKYDEVYDVFQNNLKMLRNICLNIYGLATIVINQKSLYDDKFKDLDPQQFGLIAHSKKSYKDYAKNKKDLIKKLLKRKLDLYERTEQLNKCTNEKGISYLTPLIEEIKNDINDINNEIKINDYSFRPYVKQNLIDIQERERLNKKIFEYFEHFEKAKDVEAKKRIIKVIDRLIDAKIKEESEYTYGYCNMTETLTIIRNSFSHIGRVYIGKNRDMDTFVILNDYDNNHEKSGEVICRYSDLITLIMTPFLQEEKEMVLERKDA